MTNSRQQGMPLASILVRRIFPVYLALAIALTLSQILFEYDNTYSDVLKELDAGALVFEPAVSDALWNYEESLLHSIAQGMIKSGAITGVEISDTSRRINVAHTRSGHSPDGRIDKRIELFHTYRGGVRTPVGFMSLYSHRAVVIDRLKFNVSLILVASAFKTTALWLIIMFFANRLLARPLQRLANQIGAFDLAAANEPSNVDLEPGASAELVYLRDTFIDLTRRAIRGKQLAVQKEAAEAANLAKSRFLAAASHDLRQPLHAINLYLGALSLSDLPPRSRTPLLNAQRCAQAMDEMFRSLLDVSRLDTGAMKPEVGEFVADTILDRIRAQFALEAQEKRLSLRVVRCSAVGRSDPKMVERILCNFVANALRYTEKGTVVVGCRRWAGKLRFAVYDTGPGIPAAQQRDVFRDFYQIGESERNLGKGGLGLGLAIVDRLAQLLGLPVTLVSHPGRGSMFAVDVERVHLYQLADTAIYANTDNTPMNLFVTVIDDDRMILEATRSLLEEWGCGVVTATGGKQMLERLSGRGQPPDAIICDYRLLNGESGIDVVKVLRKRFGSNVPALLLTADTGPEPKRELERNQLKMLHKPIDPEVLRLKLRELIEHRERASSS